MKLAFDAQCFTRPRDSMDRVLRVLVCAAEHVEIEFELWSDQPVREDASGFASKVRSIPAAGDGKVDAFWSPELNPPPIEMPAVATLHDINPLMPDGRPFLARWKRQRRYRQNVGRTLPHIQQLVTDTEDAKGRVADTFPQTKNMLSTVPLFVDPDIAPVTGPEGDALLQQQGLTSGYILFVGSMRKHKNWDGLMRAYAALPPALQTKYPLVYAGRNKRAAKDAEKLAASLGVQEQVHMTGVVDDPTLHALYGGARVLVCPSFMEGFGFPPLEAMACGIPVVATNRTCVPEVLGDAAYYVDPDSAVEIAVGLELVLTDESTRDRQIEAGLKRVGEYTPERTGRAMLDVLKRLH